MIELRTPAEIDEMRAAGRFVAETLATLRDETKVGTNLLAIDRRAHDMIRKAGAESCYIDYHPSFGASPFGKVICTSVNDAVLHGLPHDYALRDGDLVTLDFAVSVDGWVADSAVSFVVGTPRDEDLRLIDTTERALAAAIETSVVGKRIGGTNVFGGGFALYDAAGNLVGGVGVSGDTSCADHNIGWKTRFYLNLDNVPGGVAPGGTDNILYDIDGGGVSASGFGHPHCLDAAAESAVANDLPVSFPVGPPTA